ncbi:hypothetical protein [Saccharicrinis fermentans]|uniref:Uncharacterized protein n=1 Tax=Saccharicrinis fermentans DSM 9555 = JCM 21142 TaxID=869213 RepID=W7Y713_9BACT|nr:hypothetical protein [Saccharicrinis fermentans]GAF04047.1 hypothetical protein JCM21142_72740 [Saccharicrinis fermentans DSM 9555 = JCM 21142]
MKAKILNYILATVLLILVIKMVYKEKPVHQIVVKQEKGTQNADDKQTFQVETTHQAWVWLTVAEGKRLIAKGLKEYPPIKERLKNGYILITKGTTNTYVAEEFLNDSIMNGDFVLGRILPAGRNVKLKRGQKRKEIVFKNGAVLDTAYQDILNDMKEGDIVMKGANIINYKKNQAGILIGHPTAGTTGVLAPMVKERKLRLIIPVGLEKESSQDIDMLSQFTKIPHDGVEKKMPYIWSIKGELFTELEAIQQFANVQTMHIASGGIGGAEGAVTICIRGSKEEVEKALAVVKSVQGEPSFVR